MSHHDVLGLKTCINYHCNERFNDNFWIIAVSLDGNLTGGPPNYT